MITRTGKNRILGFSDTSKKICTGCKNEIHMGVCESYLVSITDDGLDYECMECVRHRLVIELEKENFCRKRLESILVDIGRGRQ